MTADERRRRAAAASLVFAVVTPLTYSLERSYEVLRTKRIDPSLILMSNHVDFLWRAAVAGWFGVAAAAMSWVLLSRRDGAVDVFAERMAFASVLAGALVAMLSWQLP